MSKQYTDPRDMLDFIVKEQSNCIQAAVVTLNCKKTLTLTRAEKKIGLPQQF